MYIRVYKVHIDTCTYKVRVYICTTSSLGLSGGSDCKESACNGGSPGFDPWVGKIPQRRAWQPTPVFLPGESPWTEEPGRLQSMRLLRVGHD